MMTARAALLLLLLATAAVAQQKPVADKALDEALSPSEREGQAKRAIERMRDLVGQVEKLAGQARDEKDIVKLNCVNEKLTQGRGLLRVSEQADGDLREAHARHEDDQAKHAFTKVTIAARKVGQLRQDAEQCIGQLAFYNDEKTLVDVEVPANLPGSDPTALSLPPALENRPVPASGF